MINQGLVRELILKGDINKIREVMEQNNTIGMCTFDQSLLELYKNGYISEDMVISNSDKPSDMKIKVQQAKLSGEVGQGDKDTLSSLDTSRLSFSE